MATLTGTSGNDSMAGGAGSDVYDAGAGHDAIYYGTGNDTVYGGAGNDRIDDEHGTQLGGLDAIYGGDGDDTAWSGADDDRVYGGAGNDWLNAEDGDDVVEGGDGNDMVEGAAGHDTLSGGVGDDRVFGGAGNDSMSGDHGDDAMYGGDGDDRMSGGEHNDRMWGGAGADTMIGETAFDTLYGGDGSDALYGGAQGDSLSGETGDDLAYGGSDDDRIAGGAGNDTLHGDAGNDTLSGGIGTDSVYGGAGNDTVHVTDDHGLDAIFGGEETGDRDIVTFSNWASGSGVSIVHSGDDAASYGYTGGATGTFSGIEATSGTEHADTVDASASSGGETFWGNGGDDSALGGSGADSFAGGSGQDRLAGGGGNDALDGGSGDDSLSGGAGDDTLLGGDGADSLDGGAGNDSIAGGAGADRIRGGTGNDALSTGSGQDVVILDQAGGQDRVTDFDLTQATTGGAFVDQIDVGALRDADGNPVDVWDVVVSDDGQGNALLTFPGGETLVLQGVPPSQMTGAQALHRAGIPCFTADTLVRVPGGAVPVESLRVGDLVVTRDDGPQPLRWAAMRRLAAAELAANARLRPVRIAPGALGNAGPLLVSRQHAVLVRQPDGEERLVRACHLTRLGGSARVAHGVRGVTYVHLMFDRHQVLQTDGVWSESFYPGPEALRGAGAAARRELALLLPGLAGGTDDAVAAAFGPPARSFLHPAALPERLVMLRAPVS